MTLALPILYPPAKPGELRLADLQEALTLSIEATTPLALNADAYAFILTDTTQDPEFPPWSGYAAHRVKTSEWRSSPTEEDENEGDFYPLDNLQVIIPKETLAAYQGKVVHVGYAIRGESGVTSSPTIPLTITSCRTHMRTVCHVKPTAKLPGGVEKPRYFELEREAQAGDFVYFALADLWVLITARYFFMGTSVEDNVVVLDTLVVEPPTDIRPPAA